MRTASRNEDQVALTLLDNPRNNLVAMGELLEIEIGEIHCLGVNRILIPQLGTRGLQKVMQSGDRVSWEYVPNCRRTRGVEGPGDEIDSIGDVEV